jgi:hypothetical protein
MSQNEKILKHLKSGKSLTPLQALRLCGSLRLGARIHNLREQGHNIKTRMVRRGGARVAEYSL